MQLSPGPEPILTEDRSSVDWTRVCRLFTLVGWDPREPEEVRAAFAHSTFCCFALDEQGELIGFGRTVDDVTYYSVIVDVVVDPAWQGRGVGRRIVTHLRERLTGFRFVTLTSAPGKDGFYQKLGWRRQTSAFLWPRDERQAEQHCRDEGHAVQRRRTETESHDSTEGPSAVG